MTYRVVRITPEYAPRIAAFAVELWSGDVAANAAYFEWKHLSNPYVREPLFYIALDGDRIVGMRGFMGARWEIAGHRVDIPCAGDLLVCAGQRNRGIVKLIMDFAMRDLRDQGYPFVFNLSGGPQTQWSQLALGWKGIGPIEIVEGSSRPILFRLRRFGRRSTLLRTAWIRAWRAAPSQTSADQSGIFRHLDCSASANGGLVRLLPAIAPGRMADCAARRPDDGRLRHARDATYLAWRYRNPLVQYRFLDYSGAGKCGFLVLAAHRYRVSPVSIADWEADSAEIALELLQTALRRGKFWSVQTWAATLRPELRQVLRHLGFVHAEPPVSAAQPRRTIMVGRVPGANDWLLHGLDLLDRSNWDLRMIFSD